MKEIILILFSFITLNSSALSQCIVNLTSPPDGSSINTLNPDLTCQITDNTNCGECTSGLTYIVTYYKIALDPAMSNVIHNRELFGGLYNTYHVPNGVLQYNMTYYWQARFRHALSCTGYPWQNCGTSSTCDAYSQVRSFTVSMTGVNQTSSEVPEKFELSQNYPNPFNPVTHFGFRIAGSGLTKLRVFDAIGNEVEVLLNRQLQPGTYEADWDASAYPSGVYFYRLESGSFTETKKMVLMK